MEGSEALLPQLPIATDPGVDFREWLRAKPINPPLRLTVHLHQASLPQHSQVSGDAGPSDRKKRGQLTRGGWPVPQNLKHRAPALIGQSVQNSIHPMSVPTHLRNCQGTKASLSTRSSPNLPSGALSAKMGRDRDHLRI
jgi:hypothetical protein